MPRLHETRRRTNATHITGFAAGYCCRDSRCSHARASVRAGEAAEGNSSGGGGGGSGGGDDSVRGGGDIGGGGGRGGGRGRAGAGNNTGAPAVASDADDVKQQ